MVIKELKMDLACPESWFQAPTADDCFAAIEDWKSSEAQTKITSLCSAVESMLEEDMNQTTCEVFAEIGTVNLFAIASGEETSCILFLPTPPSLADFSSHDSSSALFNLPVSSIFQLRATAGAPSERSCELETSVVSTYQLRKPSRGYSHRRGSVSKQL